MSSPSETVVPSPIERVLSWILHLYPFVVGHVKIVSLRSMERVFPKRLQSAWAQSAGGSILVPLNDYVGRSIFLFGQFEPRVCWWIRRLLRPGDTAVDVGANLGCMSVLMGNIVGSSGSVLSFEPSTACLPYLQETLSRNSELPVKLYPVGLGDVPSKQVLSIPEGNLGKASVVAGRVAGRLETEIEIRTLADVCRENEVERVDFMKIDVEGYETEVLKGTFLMEEAAWPRRIVFEQRRGDQDAIALCQEHGYVVRGISHRNLFSPDLLDVGHAQFGECTDYLAEIQGS